MKLFALVPVELDPSGMADGQVAGRCLYNRNCATIAVRHKQGALVVETAHNQTILRGPAVAAKPLWLRSEWGWTLSAASPIAPTTKPSSHSASPTASVGLITGERMGLFSYNNQGDAGYTDFGLFTYRSHTLMPTPL
ncbi:MAG: hypothetical protein ABIT76_11190 [Chthoniobacterales bacterium]